MRSHPTGQLLSTCCHTPGSEWEISLLHMNETRHSILKQTTGCEMSWSFATSNFRICFGWHLIWELERGSKIPHTLTYTVVYSERPCPNTAFHWSVLWREACAWPKTTSVGRVQIKSQITVGRSTESTGGSRDESATMERNSSEVNVKKNAVTDNNLI